MSFLLLSASSGCGERDVVLGAGDAMVHLELIHSLIHLVTVHRVHGLCAPGIMLIAEETDG